MKGMDKDLAAHFTIINKYGIVLYGEKIDSVFSDVPLRDYIDSIFCDIENAPEDIIDQPVYIVLNLCRVLAFLKNIGLIYEDGIIYKASLKKMDEMQISRVAYTHFDYEQLQYAYLAYCKWYEEYCRSSD